MPTNMSHVLKETKLLKREITRGVMANVLGYDTEVSEFEHKSRY